MASYIQNQQVLSGGVCIGDGVWSEEAHLVWAPAGLQLMAQKLKADSEEWGPAAESRPIAQKLYESTGALPLWGLRVVKRPPTKPIPLQPTAPTLCKPPPQGPIGVTDMRAGALGCRPNSANACHVTLSKPPDLSDSGCSYGQIEVGIPALS